MYIITDVMKAYQVTAVGFDDDDFCLRKTCNNVTVGFQYSKFRLTSEGQVAEQVIYAMALSFFIILPPHTSPQFATRRIHYISHCLIVTHDVNLISHKDLNSMFFKV